ncbi:MAG: hypothetical protein WD847_06930 [Pirellulales bacterium]
MKPQISLSKLFLVTFVYAAALALLSPWNFGSMQKALALGILTFFVGFDLSRVRLRQDVSGESKDAWVFCAYYSTAFAFATLGCMVGFLCAPFSPSAAEPERTLAAAYSPLVRTFAITVLYIAAFTVFSSIAFVMSLVALRRSQTAWWLLIINSPGIIILLMFAIGTVFCVGS